MCCNFLFVKCCYAETLQQQHEQGERMTTATLRAVGNSVAVVIPKQWLTLLGLSAGVQVELNLDGDRLTLQPKAKRTRKKYQLTDLLAKCDQSAPLPPAMQEWDNAPAKGNEVW